MYYTIYKTTHKVSGKFYIGMHRAKDLDDGYMGSGLHLRHAIEKYGLNEFSKEITHVFDNEKDMIAKEIELVNREFCLREDTYNIKNGGKGGWDHVNSSGKSNIGWKTNIEKKYQFNGGKKGAKTTNEKYGMFENFKIAGLTAFKGKKHIEEVKEKIGKANSKHQTGKKNSQFGTMWITDGTTNKKIKKDEFIPERWYRGRIMPM